MTQNIRPYLAFNIFLLLFINHTVDSLRLKPLRAVINDEFEIRFCDDSRYIDHPHHLKIIDQHFIPSVLSIVLCKYYVLLIRTSYFIRRSGLDITVLNSFKNSAASAP